MARAAQVVAPTSVSRGWGYLDSKQFEWVQKEFERVVEISISVAEDFFWSLTAFRGLSILYSLQGRWGEAIRGYRKAIDIYPTHAEAIAHIGYLYAKQKNELDKGIRFIQLAIKYQPDNEYFNLLLAELYRKAGHPAKTKLLMEQFYIERGELIKAKP